VADWTEKYRPTTLSEVRGHDSDVADVREWAETWDDHREALIIHGPPGIGKTTTAHALANEMGWSAMELNASDSRTREEIERIGGGAAMNQSLETFDYGDEGDEGGAGAGDEDPESGRQLLILDEADNLHHNKDRGGAAAMTRLVKSAEQPIVLIGNDYYGMSRGLRNACRSIEFSLSARSITPALRHIAREEGLDHDESELEAIAKRNEDDLRGAIKDLQAGTTGDRDTTHDVFTFLDAVLKEQPPEEALSTAYDTDETPDDLLLWIEDKVPTVYEGSELKRAYDHIGAADRWLGRVRATQNYTYWRYATDNLAAGVAAARDRDRGGWTRYGGAPYRSAKDTTRDYIARQIAGRAGVSTATARREILPYLAAMTHHCTNRDLTVRMAARYDLDAEHVAFVTGSGKTTNKVQSIVEDAAERREQEAVDHSGDAFLERVEEAAGDENEDMAGEDAAEPTIEEAIDGGAPAANAAAGSGDDDGDADEVDPDDQQSGLSDFM